MSKASAFFAALASLVLAATAASAAPLNKCTVNGTVTYQQAPCPPDQVRKHPTVQELNAEENKRRAAMAAAMAAAMPSPSPSPSPSPTPGNPSAAPVEAASPFKCDGRRYCSQMSSCAEATYFLAHCPGVKMDGDRDGIPCEDQWCRP